MTRRTFQRTLAGLVLAMPLLFLPTSAARGSTGVLLTVKGDVTVTVNRVSQPAKTGFRVGPGAMVTGRRGSATLLLLDGKSRTIQDGNSYTLPGDEPEETRDPLILGLMGGPGAVKGDLQQDEQAGRSRAGQVTYSNLGLRVVGSTIARVTAQGG